MDEEKKSIEQYFQKLSQYPNSVSTNLPKFNLSDYINTTQNKTLNPWEPSTKDITHINSQQLHGKIEAFFFYIRKLRFEFPFYYVLAARS